MFVVIIWYFLIIAFFFCFSFLGIYDSKDSSLTPVHGRDGLVCPFCKAASQALLPSGELHVKLISKGGRGRLGKRRKQSSTQEGTGYEWLRADLEGRWQLSTNVVRLESHSEGKERIRK